MHTWDIIDSNIKLCHCDHVQSYLFLSSLKASLVSDRIDVSARVQG